MDGKNIQCHSALLFQLTTSCASAPLPIPSEQTKSAEHKLFMNHCKTGMENSQRTIDHILSSFVGRCDKKSSLDGIYRAMLEGMLADLLVLLGLGCLEWPVVPLFCFQTAKLFVL